MDDSRWERITNSQLIGFGAGLAVFAAFLFLSEPGFIFIIDHANLLFHEAGHPIIGFFSDRLMVYGGTIGQLTFPAILAVSFWRKGLPLSLATCVIWFFENWLNIGRYMADARAQVLPLVGGGEHDWFTIFTNWDVLEHDTEIARVVRITGWLGMLAPIVWVAWRAWQDRSRTETERGL